MWAEVGSLPVGSPADVDACGLAIVVAGEVVSVGWKMKGERSPKQLNLGRRKDASLWERAGRLGTFDNGHRVATVKSL